MERLFLLGIVCALALVGIAGAAEAAPVSVCIPSVTSPSCGDIVCVDAVDNLYSCVGQPWP